MDASASLDSSNAANVRCRCWHQIRSRAIEMVLHRLESFHGMSWKDRVNVVRVSGDVGTRALGILEMADALKSAGSSAEEVVRAIRDVANNKVHEQRVLMRSIDTGAAPSTLSV